LILRSGTGLWSWLFRKNSPKIKEFSHIGIVKIAGAQAFVIHSEANDLTGRGFVRADPFDEFVAESTSWAIYRLHGTKEENAAFLETAESLLGTPFDWKFDTTDPSALYCTELVVRANILCGRKIPFKAQNNIYPLDSFQDTEVSTLIMRR